MRLIKMSPKEFPALSDLNIFFTEVLPSPERSGRFLIPKGWLAKNGLSEGETLLFTYNGRLRFKAKAASVRLNNTYQDTEKYPFCFLIDMKSVVDVDIDMRDLESALHRANLTNKKLQGQGWTKFPESDDIETLLADA